MESSSHSKTSDCFDINTDKLAKLSFTSLAQSSASWQNKNIHEQILLDQFKSTIRKYIVVCEKLNINSLSGKSFLGIIFLLSRYTIFNERSWQTFVQLFEADERDLIPPQESFDINELTSMLSNADWKNIFDNVNISADCETSDIYEHKMLHTLLTCMESCCLPFPGSLKAETLCKFFLNMCPTQTQAARMCESYLCFECQNLEVSVPHDLELKTMRCLAMFHDHKISTSDIQQTLHFVLGKLHLKTGFLDAVRLELNERAENIALFASNRNKFSRPRLADLVQRVHHSNQSYESSFKHWTAMQKFAINTSLRMQKILYFMRVQCKPITKDLYCKHFSEKIADVVMHSTVDEIDAEPILSCIQTIMTYKHRVHTIINFRTECLAALPYSVRSNLQPATVLQLYICAFQHESIRNRCLESVLQGKVSYNLNKKIQEFIQRSEFEIEPVVSSLMDALYALATPTTKIP